MAVYAYVVETIFGTGISFGNAVYYMSKEKFEKWQKEDFGNDVFWDNDMKHFAIVAI
jgi:hypothetical protein